MVTPFGTYDYTRGGHIILHDARVILEMPAGCSVFFPSATMMHQTIAVGEHETRNALTGYTASTIFQYVEHGFKCIKEIKESGVGGIRCSEDVWLTGLERWPNVNELYR